MVCAIIYNYNIPVFIYLIIPHFIYALMQISINQQVILHRWEKYYQCTSMQLAHQTDLQQLSSIYKTTDVQYPLQIAHFRMFLRLSKLTLSLRLTFYNFCQDFFCNEFSWYFQSKFINLCTLRKFINSCKLRKLINLLKFSQVSCLRSDLVSLANRLHELLFIHGISLSLQEFPRVSGPSEEANRTVNVMTELINPVFLHIAHRIGDIRYADQPFRV